MGAAVQHYKRIKRFREKFLIASLAFALGILIGVALAMKAYASYQTEYIIYEPKEQSIQITGEIIENHEAEKLAEGIKSKYVKGDCQCVSYAKSLTGYSEPVGRARNWPTNSERPMVGGVVITSESASGHVGVITRVFEDTIVITEKNYIPCKISTRELNKNDPRIIGFWVSGE